MEKIQLKDKRVTVMGIGLHGGSVEMIKWLLKQGARVTATDMKSVQELAPSLEKFKDLKNLTIVTGQHRMEDFENAEMVIKNPAVRWDNKYIKAATDKNVAVETDSSLFFKLCASKNIIGVTGTKGKTTTSTLIYEILKSAGEKVVKVGIGQEAVMNKLSEIDKDTWVVFELSSWRLSSLKRARISPHIAVVTNLYQDHLNYYDNMQDYMADKRKIFEFQKAKDFVILNWDNEETRNKLGLPLDLKSQVVYFSMQKIGEDKTLYVEEGKIKYNFDGVLGEIMEVKEIGLRGGHNVSNVLAAAAVGIILNIKPDLIRKVAKEFKGTAHRLELVRTIDGLKIYNDTAATTPESAMAALNAFSEPINLICGGSNKNLELESFAKKISKTPYVKRVFLLSGAATDGLRQLIIDSGGEGKITGVFESMEAAVEEAFEKSQGTQEIILLSPGCASFGMFQNEFDRGDKFKKAVEALS